MSFLEYTIFGNTVKQFLWFIIMVIIGFIVTKIFVALSKGSLKKFAKRTKTQIDDIIIGILEKPRPFQLIIVTIFFNIGINFLTVSDKLLNAIKNISFMIYVLGASLFIIKFVIGVIDEYLVKYAKKTDSKYDDQLVPLLKTLTKIIVIIVAILLVLSNLGYNVTSLLAGLGIGGLAVAMASKDILENLIAGVVLFAEKTYKVGDFIKTNTIVGTVEEVKIRSTRIRKLDGTLVTLPNKLISENDLENFNELKNRRADFKLGLVYGTSVTKMQKAKKVINSILKKHKEVLDESIMISFVNFNDFSLDIRVVYHTPPVSYLRYLEIIDEVNIEIKKQFEKEKLEMAFPTQTVEVKK